MTGRTYEINSLKNSLKSANSELIAVYGRRRVGKTFLIRNIYGQYTRFEVTGLYNGTTEKQLDVFFDELKRFLSNLKKKIDPRIGKRHLAYSLNS